MASARNLNRATVEPPTPDKPYIIVLAGMTRVDAVMYAWSDWRRHGNYDPAMRPGDDSWLGRMVKIVKRATGEEKLPPSTMPRYDDDLMAEVGRIVQGLPPNAVSRAQIRPVIIEHYCYAPWWPVWNPHNPQRSKAGRCGLSRSQYFENLKAGREMIDRAVPWGKVVMVYPEKLRELFF